MKVRKRARKREWRAADGEEPRVRIAVVSAGKSHCQKGWTDEAEMDVSISDQIMYLQDLSYVRLLSCHCVPECMQADKLCFA